MEVNHEEQAEENEEEPSDTENEEIENHEPELKRSGPPDYYGVWVNFADDTTREPATVQEALSSPDKEKWKIAMEKEMESNGVWDIV